jgi:hypothetical protein
LAQPYESVVPVVPVLPLELLPPVLPSDLVSEDNASAALR